MADTIVFKLGENVVELNRIDTNEIRGRAVERTLPAVRLHDELTKAVKNEAEQAEVVLDNEMREELALDLDAIRQDHELTPGQEALRKAAQEPISPQPS